LSVSETHHLAVTARAVPDFAGARSGLRIRLDAGRGGKYPLNVFSV
jgi:hypothetical protein